LDFKEKVAICFFIVGSVHLGVIFLYVGCTLLYQNITQGSESVCFVDPDVPENAVLVGSDSSVSVRDRWVAVGFGVSFAAGGLLLLYLAVFAFFTLCKGIRREDGAVGVAEERALTFLPLLEVKVMGFELFLGGARACKPMNRASGQRGVGNSS